VIVSTTLAGPGAEASIVDALRSCAHLVECHYVLLSGCDVAAVKAAVTPATADGLRAVIWREYDWPGSYGEARTHALRVAEEFGATWALTVDCDERLLVENLPPAQHMDNPAYKAFTVPDRDLLYQKPRLVRCGAGVRWVGACSERLDLQEGEIAMMDGAFWELPKTPEQERARLERGVANMPRMIEQDDHPQWYRHMAECLIGLGRVDEGMMWHERLLEHPKANPHCVAWAHYRLAEQEICGERYEAAERRAALALARAPGFIQEFGWLLAHISVKRKRYAEGVTWAEYALNAPLDMTRGGHRSPTWRDGCQSILASARDAQGKPARRPAQLAAFSFEGRREAFGDDYAILASALIQTVFPTATLPMHLDLGAGSGLLVEAMQRFGVVSMGLEASEAAEREASAEAARFVCFGQPLETWGPSAWERNCGAWVKHDLISCVEVAEHIPAERADELVEACCERSSRWIYFSAAPPGQGGHGHVNEQPRAYWEAKFAARGWRVDWGMTEDLIARLSDVRRCWWLKRNALILRKF
jgi:hypothetical protein